ncbi:uncharacterized protein SPPG_05526 [Spizellomyces punctatus DAOM BR117]|uniref:CCHC-type domain-containing protein n=1 Tax=Spizellomyces punctatus (strain DAOM BR117) TaxID=645134 RepID=A0A0L0HE30_SPIPD|nr:uncharacterized protein SPPG_05526 [Spizellomyces punctatus DAOM BR117]KNC99271.1 hypothetical protein SPPG_05526 [Spizellomyces punctatus DAOM BR117]|eukprot:XP_016607311.1 hypothetical protein SPPG_05526 [Spizellomyces punctatus DAOM BR117]
MVVPPDKASADFDLLHRNEYTFCLVSTTYTCPFSPGDVVYVKLRSQKDTGRATILADADPSGRILVQYHADKSMLYHVNPQRLVNVYPTDTPLILLCENTTDYRTLARSQIDRNDVVAEIGSSYGVCTNILSQHAKQVFGIEVSQQLVDEARKRYPHLVFHNINILEHKSRAATIMQDVNKVFVDIGGNREIGVVVRALAFLIDRIKPSLIVVKSEELFESAQRHLDKSSSNNESGRIPDGPCWFETLCKDHAICDGQTSSAESWFLRARRDGFTKNPLRYPIRMTSDGVAICKLQNYREEGCQKLSLCRFDHIHCHHCGHAGHKALHCPLVNT